MGTVNRVIKDEHERKMAALFVESRKYPFTLTITDGKPRTSAQNRLQHKWMQEIAEQKGDMTAEEVRAYCKLTIGVPILRSQNAAFKERYDSALLKLTYEQKLAIMSEPLNLPVTSLMSTKQLTEYLEGIIRHFGEQGIILTMPDDLRNQINSDSDEPSPSSEPAGDTASAPAAAGEDVPPPPGSSPAASILDCAKDMLMLARGSYKNDAERDEVLSLALGDWEAKLPDEQPKLDDIGVAARAVATKARTLEQARAYLSERLNTTVEELGGNG